MSVPVSIAIKQQLAQSGIVTVQRGGDAQGRPVVVKSVEVPEDLFWFRHEASTRSALLASAKRQKALKECGFVDVLSIDEGEASVVMEDAGHSLRSLIIWQTQLPHESLKLIAQTLTQSLLAVAYHESDGTHGNLKLDNVFLRGSRLLLSDPHPGPNAKSPQQELADIGLLIESLALRRDAFTGQQLQLDDPFAWTHLGRDAEKWREICLDLRGNGPAAIGSLTELDQRLLRLSSRNKRRFKHAAFAAVTISLLAVGGAGWVRFAAFENAKEYLRQVEDVAVADARAVRDLFEYIQSATDDPYWLEWKKLVIGDDVASVRPEWLVPEELEETSGTAARGAGSSRSSTLMPLSSTSFFNNSAAVIRTRQAVETLRKEYDRLRESCQARAAKEIPGTTAGQHAREDWTDFFATAKALTIENFEQIRIRNDALERLNAFRSLTGEGALDLAEYEENDVSCARLLDKAWRSYWEKQIKPLDDRSKLGWSDLGAYLSRRIEQLRSKADEPVSRTAEGFAQLRSETEECGKIVDVAPQAFEQLKRVEESARRATGSQELSPDHPVVLVIQAELQTLTSDKEWLAALTQMAMPSDQWRALEEWARGLTAQEVSTIAGSDELRQHAQHGLKGVMQIRDVLSKKRPIEVVGLETLERELQQLKPEAIEGAEREAWEGADATRNRLRSMEFTVANQVMIDQAMADLKERIEILRTALDQRRERGDQAQRNEQLQQAEIVQQRKQSAMTRISNFKSSLPPELQRSFEQDIQALLPKDIDALERDLASAENFYLALRELPKTSGLEHTEFEESFTRLRSRFITKAVGNSTRQNGEDAKKRFDDEKKEWKNKVDDFLSAEMALNSKLDQGEFTNAVVAEITALEAAATSLELQAAQTSVLQRVSELQTIEASLSGSESFENAKAALFAGEASSRLRKQQLIKAWGVLCQSQHGVQFLLSLVGDSTDTAAARALKERTVEPADPLLRQLFSKIDSHSELWQRAEPLTESFAKDDRLKDDVAWNARLSKLNNIELSGMEAREEVRKVSATMRSLADRLKVDPDQRSTLEQLLEGAASGSATGLPAFFADNWKKESDDTYVWQFKRGQTNYTITFRELKSGRYITTTEIPAILLFALSQDPETKSDLREFLGNEIASDNGWCPRVWTADASGNVSAAKDWGPGIGRTGTQNPWNLPLNFFDPRQASELARLVGCDLPSKEDWLSLCEIWVGSQAPLETANLRDRSWQPLQKAAHARKKANDNTGVLDLRTCTYDLDKDESPDPKHQMIYNFDDGEPLLAEVNAGKPTPQGFFHIVGNVAEICVQDSPTSGRQYFIAGGSAFSRPIPVERFDPKNLWRSDDGLFRKRSGDVGFRLVFQLTSDLALLPQLIKQLRYRPIKN